jgi:uncharacterized membrane protein YsdA (DUF1294 family)/cold shock CspA family protein
MRYQGRLQDWNDDKGFGFVSPNGGGERAFVHIKAFERGTPRPINGQLISYLPKRDERGRLAATAIRPAATGKAPAAPKHSARRLPRTALGLIALSVVALAWLTQLLPDWIAATVGGTSLLALVFYAYDKGAAQRGDQRTPESTLHLIALLGGWPGALLAQGLFRHKSSKRSFQQVFWVTVVLNVIALAAVIGGWLPDLS